MGGDLLWSSESDLASCHGVTQLGLVVDEGHDAQVCLDEQGLLQDQHTVGTTRNGLFFMGLLHSLHQLRPEVVQLQKSTRPEPSDTDPDLQQRRLRIQSPLSNQMLSFNHLLSLSFWDNFQLQF